MPLCRISRGANRISSSARPIFEAPTRLTVTRTFNPGRWPSTMNVRTVRHRVLFQKVHCTNLRLAIKARGSGSRFRLAVQARLTVVALRRNLISFSRGDQSPPLHVGPRSRGARFELVALRAQREAPSPERWSGRSRFETARDGLRPLEATAHNATRARLRFGTCQPHRSAPPRAREISTERPTSDFLVTRGRTKGHGDIDAHGTIPCAWMPLVSRPARTESAGPIRNN